MRIDGSDYVLSKDFLGEARDPKNSTVGPFQAKEAGTLKVNIWERKGAK